SVAENFRVRDDVIRVPVMAVAVDIISHLIEHGGGRQPLAEFRCEAMHGTQRRKKKHGGLTHIESVLHVHAIVSDSAGDRVPAFGFDLPSGARTTVVLGRHLREQSVAKTERGIAKTFEMAAVE